MAQPITEETARQIYQASLDEICRAYFESDFCAFQARMHVPHIYSTEGTEQRIDTYDQMHEAFDCFRDYLTGLGVTDFIRTCTGAAVLNETKIIGAHTTEILHNGARLRQPYEVWATLELIEGSWKVTSSQNAIPDSAWQAHAFRQGVEKDMKCQPANKRQPPQLGE